MSEYQAPVWPNRANEPLPSSAMTLRDYFAAAFLSTVKIQGVYVPADEVAQNCYAVADAMLKERSK